MKRLPLFRALALLLCAISIFACHQALQSSPQYGAYIPSPTGWGLPSVKASVTQSAAVGGNASGQIPVWDGGVDGGFSWVAESTSTTLLDCDLTAEPTQTLSPDGPYTICGIQGFKQNSSGDAVAMVITHGVGLTITPASATNISGPTLTAPYLRFPIINICSTCTVNSPLRLWFYWSSNNAVRNFDQALAGFMVYNPSFNNQLTYQAFQGFQSALGWGAEVTVLQSNVTTTSSVLPFFSDNVGVMSTPAGLFAGVSNVLLAPGLVGGAWPNFQTGVGLAMAPEIPANSSVSQANASTGLNPFTTVNFYFSALRAGSTTTGYAPVLARFRVDKVGAVN